MGLVSIFLGIILLIVFVGAGFYLYSNVLGSLFLAMPKFFGNVDPKLVVVGLFAVIGLIICIGYVMSGIALLKVHNLKKNLRRHHHHKNRSSESQDEEEA